eukprot:CAMPEP_0184691222 /NCGR_PEP_ID=MMETSP0313-20130426/128_1 /TAXON_ID=2792 /ORGANISM="Porphyridium aerugineum, Strain SAG 1380-2" /LENGTH=232 /DNA_ID=CAMNT_0027148899 /DNA_START=183 /DNA_END=881 /DNA_ORIENTATION=-
MTKGADNNTDTPNVMMTKAMAVVSLAAFLGATSLMPVAPAYADVPDEKPTVRFIDDASAVQKTTRDMLEKSLTRIKINTGFDVHFVMVRSFPFGDDADKYAEELFKQWGLGESDVLIVGGTKVARAGFAVGSEAQKLLTPEIMTSIGTETFPFKARQEAYSSAALDVTNRIIPVLSGQQDPGPPAVQRESAEGTYKSKEETEKGRGKYWTVFWVLIVVSIVAPMLQYLFYTL